MSDDEAFGSDSSDDDYVPVEGEAVSEEEGSGDEEATLLSKDEEDGEGNKSKKLKKKQELGRGKRTGGIKLDNESEELQKAGNEAENIDFSEEDKKVKEVRKEEKEKKKADDLWASFMSDVGGPKPKAKTTSSGIGSLATVKKPATSSTTKPFSSPSVIKQSPSTSNNKVTVTKEYDFAGEKIIVTKEVDANSSEGKNQLQKGDNAEGDESKPSPKPAVGIKRPGGGLGNLVGKLNKAPKISTLDKSKLDWESFKQDNRLTEELTSHNRGKEGYLERKAFLERTDLRQFEIEKSLRLSTSKR